MSEKTVRDVIGRPEFFHALSEIQADWWQNAVGDWYIGYASPSASSYPCEKCRRFHYFDIIIGSRHKRYLAKLSTHAAEPEGA